MSEFIGIILLIFFLLELILLSQVSKTLHHLLGRLFHHLTKSEKSAIYFLAFMFLPGTLIHELAHAITAGVLLVHVGEISLKPEIKEDSVKLGSVQIGLTDPFRRSLIGVAPVLFGVSLLLGIAYYLTSNLSQSASIPYLVWILIFYLVFVITNTMFSSPKDLEGTFAVMVFILAIFTALYLLKYQSVFDFLGYLINIKGVNFLQKAVVLLSIPILVDLVVLGFIKLIMPKRYY